jgi:uncharacterized protein YdiU (UPF0061 family)
VLARIASSHPRVGTFQYTAAMQDPALLQRLVDHAIARHHPTAAEADVPALALFEAVLDAQAALVAQWMHVGFIHGVMNTDNTTISGETIDYGPCAFLDAFDPATVYSSIDHGGRYAFGNQPSIVQWNLARFAESLLPLIDDDQDRAVELATELLHDFPARFGRSWRAGMRAKLGLSTEQEDDGDLFDDLLRLMHEQGADHTNTFRSLSSVVRGDEAPLLDQLRDRTALDPWLERYRARLDADGHPAEDVAARMDQTNPLFIPRNHLVDEALTAATAGDMAPVSQLLDVVTRPFDERPGLDRHTLPAPTGFGESFQTFCGT